MLMEQIVDGVLAWHRIDSHGCVGTVDSTQENDWFCWYQQRVEVLWSTLGNLNSPQLTMADRRLLYRTREALTHFLSVSTILVCWCTATCHCAAC